MPTELTTAVSVMKGVQNAFQRWRRRSAFISSSVLGGCWLTSKMYQNTAIVS
jgi:hypothetical protein